jgi:hypothetical protein
VVRRRSRAEVEALVAEYETSGLSRKAFCAGRGLAVATLDVYRRRVRRDAAVPRLVAVELRPERETAAGTAAASSGMAVVLGNGRRIELGGRVDRELLAELIGIVERA